MSIEDKENQLFKKWKAKRQRRFFPDGVVSEKDYRKSKQKIVFILKEVNEKYPDNWDLRKFILDDGCQGHTWNNVTRWVDGIRDYCKTGGGTFCEKITEEHRIETLKSICSMNLKKAPGGGATKNAELKKFAKEDGDCIREQYNLYNPDITICGGTGIVFQQVMGHEHMGKPRPKKVWWYERKKGKYVICTKHPQARERSEKLQKELMDVIRKIYK